MQPFELPDFYVPWPARLNPNLEAARIHAKAWAREMGILDAPQDENNPNIWSEHAFDCHDYALLCAYIHPEAPIPELNLMTDWNVWAFYVDDYFLKTYKRPKDRAGAKKYLDRMLLFMPVDLGPLPAPGNPMERGLTDLWQRTAPAMSAAWRRRIFEDTRNLLEAFLWEVDSMGLRQVANPIEYIEMRRQVGAALWSADLVEHTMGVEIPERIAATRPMRVLKETFADGVHLRNDIFSYQREVLKEGELTNAILVVERFMGVSTQRAVHLVNDLLTSRLQQFEHTARMELEPMFEEYQLDAKERADVGEYVRGLQDWQYGAHQWHILTSRYLNPGIGLSSGARKFQHGPTGLGTSSTRTMPGAFGLGGPKKYRHVPYQKVGPTIMPKSYMPFTTSEHHHMDALRQNSKAWARRMGMLNPLVNRPGILIWDEGRFDAVDIAFFCSLAYPQATFAQLDLATRWLVWGAYADDFSTQMFGHTHDLTGSQIWAARLSNFMPVEDISSPTPVPINPVERGLADLWIPTVESLSSDARRLLRTATKDMLGSWQWEISNRIQNRIPELIDYMEMRRKTAGLDFMLAFISSVYSKDIQSDIYRTRTMKELIETAGDYVYLTNDLVSYQKEIEIEGDIHNGVLVIQNFLGCDRTEAVEIINNLMTARMKEFEHIASVDLPLLFSEFNLDAKGREELLGYVKELQLLMCASLKWHTNAGQYKEAELHRMMRSFTGDPTGLGTSAARILETMGRVAAMS